MDMNSKADKIASARKMLKNFQQKKSSSAKTSAAAPKSEFTMLTDAPTSTLTEGTGVPGEAPPDLSQNIQQQPPAQMDGANMSPAPLPVFTFPSDSGTSFSEYLGGPASTPPSSAPPTATENTSNTSTLVFATAEPPPPAAVSTIEPIPPAAVAGPAAAAVLDSERQPTPPGSAAVERPVAPPAGGVTEPPAAAPDDSPPGASMASSFTFAGSQLSGTGSQGSAASSRHSDWEYVGGQPEQEPPKQQDAADTVAVPPAHLTSETLRQLSDRLSQMTSDDAEPDGDAGGAAPPAAAHPLEARNRELAAALEAERRARTEAQRHLEDLRARVSELEQEQEQGRRAADHRLEQEQARLAEQARAQAQTIGILVAEKTELKTTADQLEARLVEKAAECDGLASRLSAAEATVHQLQEQTSRADQIEVSVQHLQSLYAQADNERNRNRELCSELQEELDEARQRLRAQLDANQALTRQLTDANSRLELAEIRLTQLGAGEAASDGARRAEERAESAAREAEQLRAERDAAAVQFGEYSAALAGRLQQAEAAREELAAQLADRPQPEPLQTPPVVQTQQTAEAAAVPAAPVTDAEREELQQLRQAVQHAAEEADTLRRELRAVSEENTRLTLAGQQQAAALHEMEVTVERVNSSVVDNGQLAREMESDRVAASRAMAQNKQLKQQLQELQDGFITLSNKKLELTESLAAERQTAAEQSQQLAELQDQLEKTTARAAEADRQNMTAHQIIDQLRHWEVIGRHAETLQTDLAAAEEKLARLQSAAAPAPAPASAGSEAGSEGALERPASAEVPPPGYTPSQSPVPRPPLEEVIREREELRARLQQFIGGGAVDPAEHEKLRSALAQLEVRFCEVMNQVAVLKEERQGLEHLCEQLQGETDTIGEYISLYQVQRSALKQQALERQQELTTLHEDRQQLRQQLSQLQQLVAQLMAGQQPPAAAPAAPTTATTATDIVPISEPAVEQAPTPDSGSSSPAEPVTPADSEPAREQTARRILNLIEQIGANEYVDDHVTPLHVCQHCRGKRVLNV